MVRTIVIISLLNFFLINALAAQEPAWYIAEKQRLAGTWITDNSAYANNQETDDAYALEWQAGPGNTSMTGILYGLKNGSKTNTYWQFIQFWDNEKKQVRVIQVSANGTKGEGYLEKTADKQTRLIQTFTNPDGTTRKEGHITEIFPGYEISTSYDIRNNKWDKRRSYTWNKKEVVKAGTAYELYLAQVTAAEAFLQLNLVSLAKEYLQATDKKFRGLEWQFLQAFLDQSSQTISAPPGEAFTVIKLSPGKDLLAAGNAKGDIILYQYPSFNIVKTLKGHNRSVSTLAFNQAGNMLASGGRDYKLIQWNLSTGNADFINDTSFTQGIYQVKYNPVNGSLGAVSWEMTKNTPPVMGFAKIFDSKSGQPTKKIETEPHPAAGLVFTQGGQKMIVNTWGEIIFCYDVQSGKELWRYDLSDPAEYNNFQDIDISPDGTMVAVASYDHRVYFLDAATGALKHRIESWEGHQKRVATLKYAPAGNVIATAGDDQTIFVWDAKSYKLKYKLIGHTGSVSSLEWAPDGNQLYSVASDGTFKKWNLANPVQASYRICNNGPWQLPVAADKNYFVAPCSDSLIAAYRVKDGAKLFEYKGVQGLAGAISNDNKRFVTADFKGSIYLWDMEKGVLVKKFTGHSARVDGVAYLDKTNSIVSVGDRSLRVWTPVSPESIKILSFDRNPFRVIQSPDESKIYVGFGDGSISIFNTVNWEEIKSFTTLNSLNEITISPDGKLIAVIGGRLIDIRDAESGARKFLLEGHGNTGYAIAFSPDSKYLVSGSYDQTFKFWDLENGRNTLTFHGYDQSIYQTKFVDEKSLLVSTSNGQVYYYDFSLDK